jgi:hypothetical protein
MNGHAQGIVAGGLKTEERRSEGCAELSISQCARITGFMRHPSPASCLIPSFRQAVTRVLDYPTSQLGQCSQQGARHTVNPLRMGGLQKKACNLWDMQSGAYCTVFDCVFRHWVRRKLEPGIWKRRQENATQIALMRLARGWGPVLVYGKGAKEAQNLTGPRRSPGSFASWGTTRPGDLDVLRLTRTPEPQSANRYGECEVSGEMGGPREEWIAALSA